MQAENPILMSNFRLLKRLSSRGATGFDVQATNYCKQRSHMLTVRIQKMQDVTVIHCAGRIAFPHASELRAAIFRHTRTRALVLDLADVLVIDAAGLGVLVSLRTWAKQTRTDLKLMNVTPRVEQLLGLTRLKSEFEVCSARDMLDLLCRARQKDESPTQPEFQAVSRRDRTSDQHAVNT